LTPSSLPPIQGTLDLLVLKTLSSGGELNGFEILDWIRSATADELIVEDGALYHALHRMEARGWVSSGWAVSEKGRRARYYTLTTAGRKQLVAQERDWLRYVAAVAKLGAKPAGG
jgi:PadR family transcriptional regulator PadR